MRYLLKAFLLLCGFMGALSLAGCGEEKAIVSLSVHDHFPGNKVLGASVNGEASSSVGGSSCCVNLPKKWKPGMTAKVSWAVYLPVDPNDPNSQNTPVRKSAIVEIQEYTPDELGSIHVHVYPDDKIRLIVTLWDFASPFYPLPRAERGKGNEVNYFSIRIYCKNPHYFDMPPTPATPRDYEWAKQWGMENGKCTDPEYLEWEKNLPAMLEENRKKQIEADLARIKDPEKRQKLREILEGKRDPNKPLDED